MRAIEDPDPQVAVVGGGAGGIELTLAIAHRLSSEAVREDCPAAHPPVITCATCTAYQKLPTPNFVVL